MLDPWVKDRHENEGMDAASNADWVKNVHSNRARGIHRF